MERPEWEEPADSDGSARYRHAPIPLHERTWRHPSELGFTEAVVIPPNPSLSRVIVLSTAIIGVACAVGFGLLLLPGTGPQVERGTSSASGPVLVTSLTLASGSPRGAWMGVESSSRGRGGALVDVVVDDSPADRAGLRVGDVIMHVDHTEVGEPDDLTGCLLTYEPGSAVLVKVRRGSLTMDVEVVLAMAPAGS